MPARSMIVSYLRRPMFAAPMILIGALAVSLSTTSVAAEASGSSHGSVSACASATSTEAAAALGASVATTKHWKTGGFSECLFLAKSGRFLVLDLASTQMLTQHYGSSRKAAAEYQLIAKNGLPAPLHRIWKNAYLANAQAVVELQDDVVGLDTIGVLGKNARPVWGRATELSDFLTGVMSQF